VEVVTARPNTGPSGPQQPARLGRYEIVCHVASGGMAEIYLARQTGIQGFEKLVIVKRIRPELAADPAIVQMFLDEARIAATLHHPNIVQVFDIGEEAGSFFFAMEFLHGEDVSHISRATLARGERIPLDHVVNIVLGVCAGLHYAHEKTGSDGRPLAIVHRDVSPQNVIVTHEGGVKLLDFGVAKAARRSAATRYGTLKGKIRYMSPEQARSLPLDRRSDVFAVGILLWELSTGRRLFSGESDFEILKQIVEVDAPPPSCVVDSYPRALEAIVLRALERDPAARFPTAQDLQLALEEFAFESKLRLSPVQLANFVGTLFDAKLEAWRTAQRAGVPLAEHLAQSLAQQSDLVELLGEDGGDGEEAAQRTRTDPSAPGGGVLPAASSSAEPAAGGSPTGAPTLDERALAAALRAGRRAHRPAAAGEPPGAPARARPAAPDAAAAPAAGRSGGRHAAPRLRPRVLPVLLAATGAIGLALAAWLGLRPHAPREWPLDPPASRPPAAAPALDPVTGHPAGAATDGGAAADAPRAAPPMRAVGPIEVTVRPPPRVRHPRGAPPRPAAGLDQKTRRALHPRVEPAGRKLDSLFPPEGEK
jgi:serine/threonine protein kinase